MGLSELLKLLAWLFRMGCKDCARGSVPVIVRKKLVHEDNSVTEGETIILFLCPAHAMERVCPTKTIKLPDKITLKHPLSQVKLPENIG